MESKSYKSGGNDQFSDGFGSFVYCHMDTFQGRKNQCYPSRNLMQDYLKFKRDLMNKEYIRNLSFTLLVPEAQNPHSGEAFKHFIQSQLLAFKAEL